MSISATIEDSQLAPAAWFLSWGILSWCDSGGLWCEAGLLDCARSVRFQKTSLWYSAFAEYQRLACLLGLAETQNASMQGPTGMWREGKKEINLISWHILAHKFNRMNVVVDEHWCCDGGSTVVSMMKGIQWFVLELSSTLDYRRLLGYDNYIYIEYIGRKMSFEVSVEKLFKRESISDQHD